MVQQSQYQNKTTLLLILKTVDIKLTKRTRLTLWFYTKELNESTYFIYGFQSKVYS